ncbi:MAG: ornithine carbamoyltransferase [Candidatus Micrarchaeota archaeon]
MVKRDLLVVKDFSKEEILRVIDLALQIKQNPKNYATTLNGKTLLMLFEKPSLRTRLSFEVGMTQLGGHGIFYSIKDSPLGKKETMHDTAKTASRYVDIIMARTYKHSDIEELAKFASVPVINALSDFAHPCQILCDVMTMQEKGKDLGKLKLAYFGDCNNNVTHDLMYAAAIVGFEMAVCCPAGEEYEPQKQVVEEVKALSAKSGAKVYVTHDAKDGINGADVVYTDSWMSYHIDEGAKERRVKQLGPYQVTTGLMDMANKDAIFMNCLPAMRGYEQTAEVIDGSQSIVFDQAENRLHIQKAIMLFLMGLA